LTFFSFFSKIPLRMERKMSDKKETSASMVLEGHIEPVWSVAVTPDSKRAVSASWDNTLKVWDLASGTCTATFKGHKEPVNSVAVTPDGKRAVSASWDNTLKVWDLASGKCTSTLKGHKGEIYSATVTPDGKWVVSGSEDKTLKVWNLASGKCLATMEGHTGWIGNWALAVTPDSKQLVSGYKDATLKVWNLATGTYRATLKGHNGWVNSATVTPDGKTIVSGSGDHTLKLWELETGQCRATWEGHTGAVTGVAVTLDGKRVVSGSNDCTLKVWDLQTGLCLSTLKGHTLPVYGVAVTPDGWRAVSTFEDGTLRVWELLCMDDRIEVQPAARFTNAKVVLVGETGAGKTGLAVRLAEDRWEITESTHGMEVRPLTLPQPDDISLGTDADIFREMWLWDFAGQPDYRLIHQLYMDETALALMVMDPQKDDPFESLGHWEKALAIAVKRPYAKVLVAGRCDRGGITVSRQKIEQYCKERGYSGYIDTSAKTGDGCKKLKTLISQHIPWVHLPYTATTQFFKTLKDTIIAVKNQGTVLERVSHLLHRLKDRLKDTRFTEAELRATVGLLAGQGLIQTLDFGDFVLMQPEYINNYASVVVRCARESLDEMGNVAKSEVLEGSLDYKDMKRLDPTDEKILLRAMLQTFLNHSLCLEEETQEGPQLVFPSYFKRDRPEIPTHPKILVTYEFTGPLEEIYSTLVVRLYYTNDFEKDELWKNAADFKTLSGKQAGFLLEKKSGETGQIKAYFESGVPEDTQVSFIKYIHEHLLKRAQQVDRQRYYICPHCQTTLEYYDKIRKRLSEGKKDILCLDCEKRVPLIDQIEKKFASRKFLEMVLEMDAQAKRKLDNESLELILEGQAKAITGEAGQIYRDVSHSDWGIDAEIEFKNEKGQASGKRVYLQLKSGDSYLDKRKRDKKEIFTIRKKRHAEYWQSHAYPVMLVIRTSDGEIRWMNITEYLKRKGPNTKQIEFDGEPFTAESLCQLRKLLLG
jgi:WD40 repeat protein